MLAATINKTGSIDNVDIQDLPTPSIAPNQILIRIKACGINPVDWKCVMGGGFEVPYILGSDIAGVVEETGSEVTQFKVGDEIIGSLEWAKQGAFAEFVATEERYIVHKPKNLSFEHAAGVPMASLTAWQGLFDRLHIQPGQKVLIHAGAGGVGLFALQFAKLKNAHVAVTCSTSNVDFLQSLGADVVIDYRVNKVTDIIKEYDAVFDSIEATEESYQVLKQGGKYVCITALSKPLDEELAKRYRVDARKYLFQSNPTQLSGIVKLIEEEKVKTFVGRTFSLAEIREALAYQMAGHSKGKNILLVG